MTVARKNEKSQITKGSLNCSSKTFAEAFRETSWCLELQSTGKQSHLLGFFSQGPFVEENSNVGTSPTNSFTSVPVDKLTFVEIGSNKLFVNLSLFTLAPGNQESLEGTQILTDFPNRSR